MVTSTLLLAGSLLAFKPPPTAPDPVELPTVTYVYATSRCARTIRETSSALSVV